jgi:hypothetical protein
MDRLGAPDQGARSSPTRPLGRVGLEIKLTDLCVLAPALLRSLVNLLFGPVATRSPWVLEAYASEICLCPYVCSHVVVPMLLLHPDVASLPLLNVSWTSNLQFHIRPSLVAVLFSTTVLLSSCNISLVVVPTDSPPRGTRLGSSSSISGDDVLPNFQSSGVFLLTPSSLLQPLLRTVPHPGVSIFDASAAPTSEPSVVGLSFTGVVVCRSVDLVVILVLSGDLFVIFLHKV